MHVVIEKHIWFWYNFFDAPKGLDGKLRLGSRVPGFRAVENRVLWWKTQGLVENTGCGGKHGAWWKTRGVVESTGCGGKHGVRWKTRGPSAKQGVYVENTGSGGKHGL